MPVCSATRPLGIQRPQFDRIPRGASARISAASFRPQAVRVVQSIGRWRASMRLERRLALPGTQSVHLSNYLPRGTAAGRRPVGRRQQIVTSNECKRVSANCQNSGFVPSLMQSPKRGSQAVILELFGEFTVYHDPSTFEADPTAVLQPRRDLRDGLARAAGLLRQMALRPASRYFEHAVALVGRAV